MYTHIYIYISFSFEAGTDVRLMLAKAVGPPFLPSDPRRC